MEGGEESENLEGKDHSENVGKEGIVTNACQRRESNNGAFRNKPPIKSRVPAPTHLIQRMDSNKFCSLIFQLYIQIGVQKGRWKGHYEETKRSFFPFRESEIQIIRLVVFNYINCACLKLKVGSNIVILYIIYIVKCFFHFPTVCWRSECIQIQLLFRSNVKSQFKRLKQLLQIFVWSTNMDPIVWLCKRGFITKD